MTNENSPSGRKTFKGPGQRLVSLDENNSPNKWRIRRYVFLIGVNFLFFASFYFDIQVLEGSLSGSRFLGFHMADPFAALQVMLASKIVKINLVIGAVTVIVLYLFIGGRSFCSWVCPYSLLAELGEYLHRNLKSRKIIKRNHTFDRRIKYFNFLIFAAAAYATGFAVFEMINPVAAISRLFVYGGSLVLLLVLALLVIEVFYSRRMWCRYFCPVGVSYIFLGRISPVRVKWNMKKCSNCKECQAVCMVPHVLTEAVNKGIDEYVTSGECTRCGLCVDICNDGALDYKVQYLDKLI